MTKIAFLGLGAMGSRMAANLIRAEHSVTVWNRTSSSANAMIELGGTAADSPRQAAEGAEVVISMVRDDEASRHVWLSPQTGAMAGMQSGCVGIECSTLSLGFSKQLAVEAKQRRLAFLDAPVAGSRPQADAGQLIFMVGGDAGVLDRVDPILRAMGHAVHHAGDSGSGTVVKLGVNSLFSIQVAAVAEVLGMMRSGGVAADKAAEIIGATPVASPAAKAAMASMLSDAFSPMFPVELVEKDLRYVEQLSASHGLSSPLSQSAGAVMRQAIRAGYGTENLTSVAKLYRVG